MQDDLDATRVLSRDEILEAMEKVDKEEAAAYKAREEEAKLAASARLNRKKKPRNSSWPQPGTARTGPPRSSCR